MMIRFQPRNRREKQTNAGNTWWKVVRDDGPRLCIQASHDIRWIERTQVTETQE